MVETLPNWLSHNADALYRFSKIKLIVADVDGTLVPSDLSKTIQGLTNSLNHHRYQVDFSIATGRTLAGVKSILEKLPLKRNIPLVLYNGSVVVNNGSFSIIHQRTILRHDLKEILQIATDFQVKVFAYFYSDPLFRSIGRNNHEYVQAWAFKCEPGREFNNMPVEWLESLDIHSSEPSAILIETAGTDESARILRQRLQRIQNISITQSGFRYIEVRPYNSDKGVALERVARTMNLNQDEVLALGDNDNDSEMLSWAGIGVAIANASPVALRHSDYECRHGIFRGAVEILRLVKHAKHYYFHPLNNSDRDD